MCKFSPDEDAPLVKIRWYVTDQPFQEFESAFNSLDWDEQPWRPRDIGEQFGYSRNYNGLWDVPGIQGGHFCGDEDEFLEGATYPYLGEPILYDPDWIPYCCPRDPVCYLTSATRPKAKVYVTITPRVQLTSATRPQAAVSATRAYTALLKSASRPAAQMTGNAQYTSRLLAATRPIAQVTANAQYTSGLTSSSRPAAQLLVNVPYSALLKSSTRPMAITQVIPKFKGSVKSSTRPIATVWSGPAPRLKSSTRPIATVWSGPAPRLKSSTRPIANVTWNVPVKALLKSSSQPAAIVTVIPAPIGLLKSSTRPIATVTFAQERDPLLKSSTRPTATVTSSGGGVTPGTSCATAGSFALGTTYTIPIPQGTGALWLVLAITGMSQYHLTMITNYGSGEVDVLFGASCIGPNTVASLSGPGCQSFFPGGSGNLYVRMPQQFMGASSVTFSVSTGPC